MLEVKPFSLLWLVSWYRSAVCCVGGCKSPDCTGTMFPWLSWVTTIAAATAPRPGTGSDCSAGYPSNTRLHTDSFLNMRNQTGLQLKCGQNWRLGWDRTALHYNVLEAFTVLQWECCRLYIAVECGRCGECRVSQFCRGVVEYCTVLSRGNTVLHCLVTRQYSTALSRGNQVCKLYGRSPLFGWGHFICKSGLGLRMMEKEWFTTENVGKEVV